ncbi:MAG: DMT family transporter [Alphaproteobacteria bacterium]|jgi:drug/metabolite transporter (DMT)-like permease|nr:DMT family transporter [Alphaproteobacteria bacterium]MBT7942998.1 DMT family transporter [Alphaproteobacteria bacterium]
MNDSSPEKSEGGQTRDGADAAWILGMPALLVFLWSTGFVGAKWGLPYAEPFTFVTIRFAIAASILTVYALAVGAPWPKYGAELRHTIIVGILLHGVYLTTVFFAIWQGAPAWTASLMTGIHPPLTALLAGPYLKERVTGRQWAGFMMGLGGVFLVVWQGEQDLVMPVSSLAALAFGLLALSTGTLYQKRHGGSQDLRTGQAVQQMAAFAVILPCALLFETGDVQWTGDFIFALAWLTGPLSIGMFSLLYVLIRRGAATRVVGVYFLVPPVVAVETFFLFGERMTGQQFVGMALAAAGVVLVTWTRR